MEIGGGLLAHPWTCYTRQETRGVRAAEKESAWAAWAGKPTCRSTCINLLFGFFENLSQNLFLYM